jgi:hypothetical protein
MISDPFYSEAGARFNHHLLRTVELVYSGTVYTARVLYQGANSFLLSISEFPAAFTLVSRCNTSRFFSFFNPRWNSFVHQYQRYREIASLFSVANSKQEF